jgi:hypothetical protein
MLLPPCDLIKSHSLHILPLGIKLTVKVMSAGKGKLSSDLGQRRSLKNCKVANYLLNGQRFNE